MKWFFVTALIVATVMGALLFMMPRGVSHFRFGECARAEIFCRATELPSVDVGCGRLVQCDASVLGQTLGQCRDVDGVSICFDGDEADVKRVLDRLRVRECDRLELHGVNVICGYSPRLSGGIWLDSRYVNIQIAYREGTVTVGSPLIFGSY